MRGGLSRVLSQADERFERRVRRDRWFFVWMFAMIGTLTVGSIATAITLDAWPLKITFAMFALVYGLGTGVLVRMRKAGKP